MVSPVGFSSPGESRVNPATQLVTIPRLALDSGATLTPVPLAYESWGQLAPERDNVILLCHALTGDAHAHDPTHPADPRAAWWNPLVGPGRAIDTRRWYVLCVNVLGGCYGSAGPTSPDPADGLPYRLRFPGVTIGDIVRSQRALLDHLGIRRLAGVAGGSIGGLQALEWAIAYPRDVDRVAVIAAGPRLNTLGVAINDIGRQAIMLDPAWRGGNYPAGAGPDHGLALARMLAMLTYTSGSGLTAKFGRQPATRSSAFPAFGPRRAVETYLHYQAEKLVRRFDANSYLYLSSAMDRYDAAEGRGSDVAALGRVRAQTLTVGIDTDWLFPATEARELATTISAAGGQARYAELTSLEGHDAFLKEWDQMDAVLRPFFA